MAPRDGSIRWPLVGGALTATLVTYLSAKVGMISGGYWLFAGVVGGAVTGVWAWSGGRYRWHDGAIDGGWAGVVAFPLTVVLFVVYDMLITHKWDVSVIGDLTALGLYRQPTGLVEKLFVYSIYETVTGVVFAATLVAGGAVGGAVAVEIVSLAYDGLRYLRGRVRSLRHRE